MLACMLVDVYRQSQYLDVHYTSAQSSLFFGGVTVITGVTGTMAGSYISKVRELSAEKGIRPGLHVALLRGRSSVAYCSW